MSILRIADHFSMKNIRNKVIATINSQYRFPSPVDKILWGRKYNYAPWVRDGYLEIICRNNPLTEKEAEMIGLKNTVRCFVAREKYIQSFHENSYVFFFF